jgi:hypothetical protein
VSESDPTKISFARIRKRRIVVALALLIAAFALFVWWLQPTTSRVAATVNGEVQSKGSAPKLLEDDIASTQIKSDEKITSGGMLTSRATAQPAEEESFLASIFKDLKIPTPVVCGLSIAESKAFIASNAMFSPAITNQVLAMVTSKLLQSNNVHEKATGMYLFALQAGWDAAESEGLNYPGCKSDGDCVTKPYQARQKATPVNAEPLVKLALASNDIGVYATALYACSGSSTGACATISYARWAQMEPDNAAAWMMAASEAETRKDSAARASALQRVVSASGYKTRFPTLAEVLTLDEIQAQPPTLLASTLSMIVGINAASDISSMGGIVRYCSRPQTMDESRRVTCDALATKMAEKDETLMGLMMAKAIGERSGWSAERLQPLKDEYDVFTGQAFEDFGKADMFSCEALSKANQKSLRVLALGERAFVRELVETSGKTVAALADGYRKSASAAIK